MINPFRKSIIEGAKSSIFRGGVREKQELAKVAGSSGLSQRGMDKELKGRGYDPTKRRSMISKISGKDEKKGLTEEQKRRNILESRRSFEAEQAAEEVRGARYSFGGRGIGTRLRVALGQAGGVEKGTTANQFGLGGNSSGFAGRKRSDNVSPPSPPSQPSKGGRPNLF